MFEQKLISFEPHLGGFDLAGASIVVDVDEYEGVKIAAKSLSNDLERVNGRKSEIIHNTGGPHIPNAIILGSLQKSRYIKACIGAGSVDEFPLAQIEGKWESFSTSVLKNRVRGITSALVLAGSDKRGTIFAAYTLSEQIGVSPWHWWADVPIQTHNEIFALPVNTWHGEPTVKYRGIFINDEAPALTGWVLEKFGPKYNSKFYEKVYELLLRMKANFLWPAMWPGYPQPGNSFFEDDPLNQKTADDYGIVISTSHHEPMQRAMIEWFNSDQGEWSWVVNKEKIRKYFEEGAERAKGFESYLTLGIRGDGDREMTVDDPIAVLEDVISCQRQIIKQKYGDETSVRQLWALYKEVQQYYENGLKIPDDVTLLFADDNFGTVRRLPVGEEGQRSGGAGLYYHLEYVGHPRSYKWLNSNTCGKMYQQLKSAVDRKANQIWVVNVGDIKPMEAPLTYVMSLAWDINCTSPDGVPQFYEVYAGREFGPTVGKGIASLLLEHDRLVALRRHEHIEPDTFSILNYSEADKIIAAWLSLEDRATKLQHQIPETARPTFFQLVLHPIKASRICTELRVSQAKNVLYGLQRRNSTNTMARHVLKLFDEDYDLSEEYHSMLGGKWNHIMRQPHYGFGNTWHAPSRDLITGLSWVQTRQNSSPIVGQMGVAVESSEGVRPGRTNEESDRTHPSRGDLLPGLTLPPTDRYSSSKRYFEIYTRGSTEIHWSAEISAPFVVLSASSGIIACDGEDKRVEITIDWTAVPIEFGDTVMIHIRSLAGDYEQVHLPISGRVTPESFHGFVESDGHISMNASNFIQMDPSVSNPKEYYMHHPFLGRTIDGGMALSPWLSSNESPPALLYDIYAFSQNQDILIELYFTTCLDTDPSHSITYSLGYDDIVLEQVRLLEPPSSASASGELPNGWADAAQDCVWKRKHSFVSGESGKHSIRFWPGAVDLVLEKIVVDFGGVRESYLGPPESMRV